MDCLYLPRRSFYNIPSYLKLSDLIVWATLNERANNEYPTWEIAIDTGLHERTIRKCINNLLKAGLLKRSYKSGDSQYAVAVYTPIQPNLK